MRIMRGLLFISVIGCAFLLAVPVGAVTHSGDVEVSGLVLGPPPADPPTIDVPSQNETFTQKNIEVKGTCLENTVVRIFRNDIFAGSSPCQQDKTYALQVDLTEGDNNLIGRQYDTNNQSSPASSATKVFYVPPKVQPDLPDETAQPGRVPSAQTAEFQLVIDYDYSFKGVTVNTPIHLPIHFSGGAAPYAISVNWGDGNSTVISRETAEQFFVEHVYKNAGVYTVKIRISDKNGSNAYLQFALTVAGKLAPVPAANLFGATITPEALPAILVPAFIFGLAGFAAGLVLTVRFPGVQSFLRRILRIGRK